MHACPPPTLRHSTVESVCVCARVVRRSNRAVRAGTQRMTRLESSCSALPTVSQFYPPGSPKAEMFVCGLHPPLFPSRDTLETLAVKCCSFGLDWPTFERPPRQVCTDPRWGETPLVLALIGKPSTPTDFIYCYTSAGDRQLGDRIPRYFS